MADFAPPPGPPPPQVPAGWKAVWNDQYKEWFYVNTHTKASQWDKPIQPVYASPSEGPPPGAPPSYEHNASRATRPEKGDYQDNNPFHSSGGSSLTEDERLARQLQEEENARALGRPTSATSRGAADGFYQQGQAAPYGQSTSPYGQQSQYGQQAQSPYGQQELPAREEKSKGLFGKLTSKLGGGSGRPSQGYPQQHYGGDYGGGYPSQRPYGGGYGGGYPPQQQYQQQQPGRTGGGGLGAGGGALLGAGAGLVGGMVLMDAIDDHDQNEYQQGYDQGQDNGGGDDGGGDDGGGDDGGGDF